MNILEKDIEEIIEDACLASPFLLYERGLTLDILAYNPIVLRQHHLGGYGIMDIVLVGYDSVEKTFLINALELKKDLIDYKTIDQGLRYRKGIDHYLRTQYPGIKADIQITLIGKALDLQSSFCYLTDYVPCMSFYTYQIDLIKGLKFQNSNGYQLNNTSFKPLGSDLIEKIKEAVKDQIRGEVYG